MRGGVLWQILLIRTRENIVEGGGSEAQILYLTLPWDSRGREVREIEVRASEDILVYVVDAKFEERTDFPLKCVMARESRS